MEREEENETQIKQCFVHIREDYLLEAAVC